VVAVAGDLWTLDMKAEKSEIFLGYGVGLATRENNILEIHSNPWFGLIISVDLGFLCIFTSAVWSQ